MTDIKSSIQEIYSLEELSGGDSIIHKRHALVKIISALVFVVTVVSFDRYEIGRLIPFTFFPALIASLSGTPWKLLGKRLALALPFVLFAGVSNIVFDRTAAVVIWDVAVSYGGVSFFAIIFRAFLCVTAVMLLVATTPFWDLSDQLRRLHLPDIFISMLEMTYRYIGTLLDETVAMYTAYMLRSPNRRGLKMRHMGSFVGQLLIRSYDRAERIYSAMKCMGYADRDYRKTNRAFTRGDWIYLFVTATPCMLLRFSDINALYLWTLEAVL